MQYHKLLFLSDATKPSLKILTSTTVLWDQDLATVLKPLCTERGHFSMCIDIQYILKEIPIATLVTLARRQTRNMSV